MSADLAASYIKRLLWARSAQSPHFHGQEVVVELHTRRLLVDAEIGSSKYLLELLRRSEPLSFQMIYLHFAVEDVVEDDDEGVRLLVPRHLVLA